MSVTTTPRGTPCAPSWDAEWIAAVTAVEKNASRRVCGARTTAGTPCTVESTHPSGRCRFHGGVDLAGGRPGNRNAATHGLYSRGLRPCSTACPLWATCPLAGADVREMAGAERPTCPYEAEEFEIAVAGFLEMLGDSGDPGAVPRHMVDLAHRVAMLQVMVNRSAAALRETDVIDGGRAGEDSGRAVVARPHAYLQAYLRLSGEYRRYLAILQRSVPKRAREEPSPSQPEPTKRDGEAPMPPDAVETPVDGQAPDGVVIDAREHWSSPSPQIIDARGGRRDTPPKVVSYGEQQLEEALDLCSRGKYREAMLAYNTALELDPELALPHYERFLIVDRRVPPGRDRPYLTPRGAVEMWMAQKKRKGSGG